MSVLPNQTNATPGDAFFWRVDAEIITAKEFISYSTIKTLAFSTGSITVGNISTTGSLSVVGDVTALNLTATDTATSYFNNTQYLTSYNGANIHKLLLADQIQGSNLVQFPDAILSSITTTSIRLDGNTLDTAGAGVGAVLLLNGQPIATTPGVTSSIQTWSYWPAISTVQMSGQNLVGATNIQGDNAFFYNINAANQIVFATNLYGPTANLSNINTNLISSAALLASSIKTLNLSTVTLQATTIKNVGTLTSQQADITTVNATSITTDSLTTLTGGTVSADNGVFKNLSGENASVTNSLSAGQNISAGNNLSGQSASIAGNNQVGTLTTNTITAPVTNSGFPLYINSSQQSVNVIDRWNLNVDRGIDVVDTAQVNINAQNGKNGIITLNAGSGSAFSGLGGSVVINAYGGNTPLKVAYGGTIALNAYSGEIGLSNITSKITLNAASILSWAGAGIPVGSVTGYNYVHGDVTTSITAGSVTAGIPPIGTVYIYAGNGTVVQNGFFTDTIYPRNYGSDLFIQGYNYSGTQRNVRLSNVAAIYMNDGSVFSADTISPLHINFPIYPFGGVTTSIDNLHVLNFVPQNVDAGLGTSINDIQLVHFVASQNSAIDGLKYITLTANSGIFNLSTLQVSSINGAAFTGVPTTISTFNNLTANTLSTNTISTGSLFAYNISGVSSIDGFSLAQLVSSVSPPTPAPSTFQQLYTSSLQANTVSTIGIEAQYIKGLSSIDGFSIAQLVSSVSPPTPAPSTFLDLYTSSLVANTVTGTLGLKLLGAGVSIQPSLDYSINLTTTGVGLTTIVTPVQLQVFSPSTIIYGDLRATTVNGQSYPPPPTSNYTQLYTSSLQANGISTATLAASQILLNGVALGPQLSSFNTLAANQISSGSLQVSSISGYNLSQIVNQGVVSTFTNLAASDFYASTGASLNQYSQSLQVSSVNGFNVLQFLSTPGAQPQLSSFNQLFTSSLLTSTVVAADLSTTTLKMSSINGYNINQLLNPQIVSSFQQLFTSSLQANQISTGVITASNVSTQNINAYTLGGISSVNGFSIAQLVSSVSPQPPVPSTVTQFYTSSLAANGITNYQTGDLNITTAAYMDLRAGVGVRINADQCNVSITAPSLVENVAQFTTNTTGLDYTVTAGRNISINSSNTLSIYNTNTAPPVGSNDLYIIGQGVTTLAGQTTTNVTSIGALNLIGSPVNINGVPAGGATSTFTQLNTRILSNNPVYGNDLLIRAANAIVLNDLGETTISLGGSFDVQGAATGATNIQTESFNSLNKYISFTAYNTFDLLSLSSLTLTGISSLNLYSPALVTTAVSTINNVPATWFSGDIRASTFNGAPLPTAGGSVTSTFQQLYTSSLNTNTVTGTGGLKLFGAGVSILPTLDNSITLATAGVGLTTIVTPIQFQVFSPSTIVYGDIRGTTFNGLPLPTAGINTGQLTSTVIGLGTAGYLSSATAGINTGQLTSTVAGLGTAGYLSSTTVTSTFNTLFTSTISGSPLNYLSLVANRSITLNSLSTITMAAGAWFSGDITASTFNGAPLPTGSGAVTSTFTQVNTRILSNNPVFGNDLLIRAANSIVLNDLGATTISLGGSLQVQGAVTGGTNIQTNYFYSLNSLIAFTAFNTLDLLSLSSLTVTGISSINIASSNVAITATNSILLSGTETKIASGYLNMDRRNLGNVNNINGATTGDLVLNSPNNIILNQRTYMGGFIAMQGYDIYNINALSGNGGNPILFLNALNMYNNNIQNVSALAGNSAVLYIYGSNASRYIYIDATNIGLITPSGGAIVTNTKLLMTGNQIEGLTNLFFNTTGAISGFSSGGRNFMDIGSPNATGSGTGIIRILGNNGNYLQFAENIDMVSGIGNYLTILAQGSTGNSYINFDPAGNTTYFSRANINIECTGDVRFHCVGAYATNVYGSSNSYVNFYQDGNNSILQLQPSGNVLLQGTNEIRMTSVNANVIISGNTGVGIENRGSGDFNMVNFGTGNMAIWTPASSYLSMFQSGNNTAVQFQPGGNMAISVNSANYLTISQPGNNSIIQFQPGGDVLIQATRTLYLVPGTDKVSVNGVLNVGSNLLMNGHDIIGASNITSTDLTMTGSNTLTLNANYMTFTGTSNFNILGNDFGITGSNSVQITTPNLNIDGAVNRKLISTNVPQPVIQYGYVSTASAFSGTVNLSIPQRYTTATSYVPFANITNDVTTTLYVSSITRGSFEIGWSGYTGFVDIVFSWNTMGN